MALEDADKTFIAEATTKAVAALLKGDALKGVIAGQVKGAIGGLKLDDKFETISTSLKAIKEAGKPDETEDPDKNKGGDTDSPELRKLRADMEKLTTQAQQSEQARLKAETDRQTERLHGATRDALAKAGVSADNIRRAMALLQTDGRLSLDDDGKAVMTYTRDWGDEAVPLDKGLAEWVKTDDGKHYLPATGASGTGGGAGSPSGHQGSSAPRDKDGKLDMGALGQRLMQGLAGATVAD